MNLCECLSKTAQHLSDEELAQALACSERCALLATRTRREAALLRCRCLRVELERRRVGAAKVLATAGSGAAV